MKVRIGVSCGITYTKRGAAFNHLDIGYTKSLLASEALPLVMPVLQDPTLVDKVLDQVDGLLLSGGVDLSPLLYGEHLMDASYRYDKRRDANDLLFYRAARKRGMPILGICRGHQLINIAEGGTLYQDIPSQVDTKILHSASPEQQDMEHMISITPGSELFQALGTEELLVNSVHHQAVKDLADTLKANATAPDGIIEGFEGTQGGWLLGVQFHPERLSDQSEFQGLMKYFVEVAGRER